MSLVHPEIFDIRDYYVDIELSGRYCRGATVADYRGRLGKEANCRCVVGLDREKFVDQLVEACSKYEGWEV
jgi:pyrimidine-specific ribonucleoside hydrolase